MWGSRRHAASGLRTRSASGIENFAQPFTIERLEQQPVEASIEKGLAIFRLGVGSQRNHAGGEFARLSLSCTDAAGGFQAVDPRHLQVHQHKIVRGSLRHALPAKTQRRPHRLRRW